MISFGPDLAADFAADAAAPSTGAAAPPPGTDGNPFGDVLGQLMAGAGDDASADGAIDEDLDALMPVKEKTAIDPTELVNPMFVEGVPAICPTPTIVWSVETSAVAPSQPSICATTATETTSPLDLANLPQPAADNLPFEPQAAADSDPKDLPPALAELKKQLAADAAPVNAPPADAPPVDASTPAPQDTPTSPVETPAMNAAPKTDRAARGSRHEKAQTETKLDAVATRSVPAIAIERAYTSNERESSKSFDSKPDSAPTPRLQSIGQPTGTPTFVVPMEIKAALNTPAPAMTLATSTPTLIDEAVETHVPQQIVQSIRMQAIDGGSEAVLRLRPEYLGEVVVAVKVEQGSVTAALQADTPAVRQWVERNESMLRQGLAEHGLQLERLTVTEKAAETENEAPPDRQKQSREEPSHQQSRRRRAQTDDATFEVTV